VGLFIAKSQVPVLPVRIFGTYDCFPRGCRFPQKADVTLVVGDLWQPDLPSFGKTGKDLYQALADEVMHRIGGLSR
jgi:1-acyl-sn-glycerol-3-phosphate acyltransferase